MFLQNLKYKNLNRKIYINSRFINLCFFNKSIFKNVANKKSNISAFSLIELSIVLIIIGLLVAGIAGGQSLIFSAKIRKAITEARNWKQAVYSFESLKGRLPGDLKNSNKIGANSDQSYKASSFGGDYKNVVVHKNVGPFVDLYLEKIIDFKPDNSANNLLKYGKSTPYFIDNTCTFYFEYRDPTNEWNTAQGTFASNLGERNVMTVFKGVNSTIAEKGCFFNEAKSLQAIEQKIDDNHFNSGSIRSHCRDAGIKAGHADWKNFINTNTGSCTYSYITID